MRGWRHRGFDTSPGKARWARTRSSKATGLPAGEATRLYRAEHGPAHVLDPGSSDHFLRHRLGTTQPSEGLRRGVDQGHLEPGAGACTGGPCPLFVLTLVGWALTRR